ncbi:RibD family protein [Phenylobacterium sp.]|jgi:diaminohydroxyphosphoribosylaminopyrimidine deaminase/5-amino-6-(5-phosphoribosylamino)uracil reductase|uniref:RibD family protein n=1 Tax=Phenylobacterium sp. TaxID=1871053 RepID=UPI000C9741A9|nr:RibD family protein [Phenylobacterium sp.]MAK81029.1 deaminase [Phenylobacterium sp.]|tara:strand:- start:26036 stop:26671 length:636 start_codon:yes stop_codon:yes gene_type:complete
MINLKLATSLDGRIATARGESRWITGTEARLQVHQLRAAHDAVVIGAGTAVADDPELTVRLEGFEGAQPARVVLDTRQRLAADSRLVRTAQDIPTYLVSSQPLRPDLATAGVRGVQIPGTGRPEMSQVAAALAGQGLRRLFVEGGGEVAASLLRAGLVDRLEWFRAPIVIGGDGHAGVGDLLLDALADAPRMRRVDLRVLGDDVWESYERI